ncbi:tRNA (adenosine(37)-N6)-threonylcarbamoyltransferase complex dimerization subunit type 1 TsaB [bacterium]|nr:MAG: tRNA (adenosine(37)-N6)-threonylcarbamoyltransferase complex dimerization subunit type 1 TsaB [bacterium]
MSNLTARLAIDASTPVCTVALLYKGEVYSKWNKGVGIHSEAVFEFTQSVLKEAAISFAEIDEIVITLGPGSYTGLRIAASAVKGMVFGTDISVIGVQTMAFFAKAARSLNPNIKRFHAVIDARRTHLYHQLFSFDGDVITEVLPMEIRELKEIESLIVNGDAIGGTGLQRLELASNKQNLTILEDSQLIKADYLVNTREEDFASNLFISRLNPAIFEPIYYTSGFAQVHQPKPVTNVNL